LLVSSSPSPPGSSSGGVNGADSNSGHATPTWKASPLSSSAARDLFGGRGVVIGSLIGALIVQVFEKRAWRWPAVDANYQVFAIGVLVIVAVSVDQWIQRGCEGMTSTQEAPSCPVLEADDLVKGVRPGSSVLAGVGA
jgi:MFS family permease